MSKTSYVLTSVDNPAEKSEPPIFAIANGAAYKEEPRRYRLLPSARLYTIFLMFIVAVLCGVFFVNFNFTLVCMVNATAFRYNDTEKIKYNSSCAPDADEVEVC